MLPVGEVGRVTNHLFRLDHFALALDMNDAVFGFDTFDWFMKHVSAAIDGRQTSPNLSIVSYPTDISFSRTNSNGMYRADLKLRF